MKPILEMRNLSKWFGEVVALNNINLAIGEGVTGLLGPNGAGKSTFIKLALGLYRPSRGAITLFGSPPRNNLAVLNRIAYCPEIDHFYDNMTGFEFVFWLNRYRGMKKQDARRAAEEACETVRISDRMHDPIGEYSKGMRQRVKIAQALAVKPDLLLLDEPMAGLDPRGREDIFALIRRLGNEGVSVLLSSHILHEIERVTDQVVLLFRGAVLAEGRIREIRDLIDEHPSTIRAATPVPGRLAARFAEEPGVLSLHFEEDALTICTRDPSRCYEVLNALALQEGGVINGIRCADDSLQSVFDYLVR
jgi:ABC-2 type transport system ATP-binding protein